MNAEEVILAARQGDVKAQCELGMMYLEGDGVPQDAVAAAEWFTQAAEQGNAGAQCELGGMYRDGEGVARDYDTAVKWYTEAAEHGDAKATYILGIMHFIGEGVPQNNFQAYVWFEIVSRRQNRPFPWREGAIEHKDRIAGDSTVAEIEGAEDAATDWIATHEHKWIVK